MNHRKQMLVRLIHVFGKRLRFFQGQYILPNKQE